MTFRMTGALLSGAKERIARLAALLRAQGRDGVLADSEDVLAALPTRTPGLLVSAYV